VELKSNCLYKDNYSVNKDTSKISDALRLCLWFLFSYICRLRLISNWVYKDNYSIGDNVFKVIILLFEEDLEASGFINALISIIADLG